MLAALVTLPLAGCSARSEGIVGPPGPSLTVVTGGLLVDGTGKTPLPNAVVVIEGNRITAVGPPDRVTIPPRARVIDARDKVVLPGLIDMHVHYRDWADQLFLGHGVTTVRDVGSPLGSILAARARSHEPGATTPRVYTCGPMLDGSPPVFSMEVSVPVRTPEAAAAAASRLIGAGVDCLKTQQGMTLPLLEAITAVARAARVPVTVHLRDAKAVDAVPLGITGLEHVSGIDFLTASPAEVEAIADLIVSRSVFVDATLVLDDTLSRLLDPALRAHPLLAQVPPREFVWWERYFGLRSWWTERHSRRHRALLAKKKAFVRMLVQKGGVITAGTDTPVPYVFPGVSLHQELALLVSAGLAPMQAIRAATGHAAALLGQADRLGTIEAGKVADLQILAANPLERISQIGSVEVVIRDGTVVWTK